MSTTYSFGLTHGDIERVVYMQHASLPPDFDALIAERFSPAPLFVNHSFSVLLSLTDIYRFH
jgi:hypothetical protein